MDTRLFTFWLRALICVLAIQAAPVSENFVVSVISHVTVHTKDTATLPCWVSPQQTAEEMEVNWLYRGQVDSPVMLYKDKTLNSASQPASYKGRVSFGQREASSASSDGLKDGDVTLKLVNVTIADAGEYTCYVSSEKHHDRATLNLTVTQTGELPLLTAVVKDNNEVNVSCESSGWYPEPKLQWQSGRGLLKPEALVYSRAPSGLVSVHSWLLMPGSSSVSCSVALAGQQGFEGRMNVQTPELQVQEGSGVAGWVLFAVALVALLALLGFFLFRKYKEKKSNSEAANAEGEGDKLLPNDLSSVLDKANYVNIQLEESGNNYIKMRKELGKNILRDGECPFPDVSCATAVRGTPGFSSGKHYWEVSLATNGNALIPPKKSWWIGVTSLREISKDLHHPSSTDNGFYFLSSSPDNPGVLQFSSNPPVSVPVSDTPRKIAVILDYDSGKLEFYNAENKSLIGFFNMKFAGEIFPLFNPGRGDQAPMEIMHRNEDAETTVE